MPDETIKKLKDRTRDLSQSANRPIIVVNEESGAVSINFSNGRTLEMFVREKYVSIKSVDGEGMVTDMLQLNEGRGEISIIMD